MNIVKCNQAHTVFKYNFVVLVNLPFVSVILCLSLSLWMGVGAIFTWCTKFFSYESDVT